MRTLLLISITLSFMLSCQPTGSKDGQKDLRFFDLEGFVRNFVSDSALVDIHKSVILNDVEESKELPDYPLYLDIEPIEHYDINRPALYDKYSVDTIVEGDQQVLQYKALDAALSVRKLRITMETTTETVHQIEITTNTHSFLEDVSMELEWQLENGYSLSRKSVKRLGDPMHQQIYVRRL